MMRTELVILQKVGTLKEFVSELNPLKPNLV
jgi:hypothetical protein